MWLRITSILCVGVGIATSQPLPKVPPVYGQVAFEQPAYPHPDTAANPNGAAIPPYYSTPQSASSPPSAALSYTVNALTQQNTALNMQITQLSQQLQQLTGNLQAVQAEWKIEKQKLHSLVELLQAERLAFQQNQQNYLDNPRSEKVLKAMLRAGLAKLKASDYRNDDHVPLRAPSASNPSNGHFQDQDFDLADF